MNAELSREKAREKVRDLVTKYDGLTPAQRRAYNETATRNDFIDPLFEALGWNMHNNAEVAREVTVGSRKRVDYAFRIRGVSRFLLEAKALNDPLDDEHVRQAIDYAWNADVDWVVLCNFSELRLYYASGERARRMQPFIELVAADFESDLDSLRLLGPEATERRELVQRAVGIERRRPVDELLFEDLGRWRRDLLGSMQSYHDWSRAQIEEAIQRILNRVIFIRSVEDREIDNRRLEPLLRQLEGRSADLPRRLALLFRDLDETYNERLFEQHFSERYAGEALSLLQLVEGLLKGRDGTPYDFAAIGADVLGAVYEQYLTQVQAERERRRQQGIYYTPRYVVSYIVRNTLTRALEAAQERGGLAAARNLRVLDPACGSGSFLIAAFDVLDDWFAQNDHSLNDTTKRRRHILRDNLFGVDLDPQAVEVTRLNLWLRAVHRQENLPKIPNIREGNSLVDESFDWHREYPQVFAGGGFDMVVGNPPYVRQEALAADFKRHAAEHYRVWSGRADLYVCFYERAHELLRPAGFFGFVSSNKFMRAAYGAKLRQYLLEQTKLQEIIDFGELPVFKGAATFPVIVLTQKRKEPGDHRQDFIFAPIKALNFQDFDVAVSEQATFLDERSLRGDSWALAPAEDMEIFLQMRAAGVPLQDYLGRQTRVLYGIKTGLNEAFVIGRGTRDRLVRLNPQSAQFILPLLHGKDVRKYRVVDEGRYIINIPKGWTRAHCGNAHPDEWMRTHHPLLMQHLGQFEERATRRTDQGDHWWELRACEYLEEFSKPKIIYPEIALESRFSIDSEGYFLNKTVFFIPKRSMYLLGILNSKVMLMYFKRNLSVLGDADERGRMLFSAVFVKRIPIVRADSDDPRRQTIERCVSEALDLAPRHAEAAKTMEGSREHEELGRRLVALDAEIDEAVCSLYGLTDAQEARVTRSFA